MTRTDHPPIRCTRIAGSQDINIFNIRMNILSRRHNNLSVPMIPSASAVYCNCSIVEAGSKSSLMTPDTLSPARDAMPYGELQRLSEFSQTIISEDLNIFWKNVPFVWVRCPSSKQEHALLTEDAQPFLHFPLTLLHLLYDHCEH